MSWPLKSLKQWKILIINDNFSKTVQTVFISKAILFFNLICIIWTSSKWNTVISKTPGPLRVRINEIPRYFKQLPPSICQIGWCLKSRLKCKHHKLYNSFESNDLLVIIIEQIVGVGKLSGLICIQEISYNYNFLYSYDVNINYFNNNNKPYSKYESLNKVKQSKVKW